MEKKGASKVGSQPRQGSMDTWRAAKNKDLETETDSMDDAEVPDEQIEPISVSNKSKSV